MAKIKPYTLSGMMELLPAEQILMDQIMDTIRRSYAAFGFTALDTPLIESSEILLAKGGGETEKQIYRFEKGDADLSLRFDLTVPLAKYVALHYNDLAFPFKRYQIGKVYRGERAQRGRYREFYQADIDVIGDGKLSIMNDAEIPAVIYTVFSGLGLKSFKIRINNRKILTGLYRMLGLEELSGDIMRTVDKLDKIGAETVKNILVDDFSVPAEKVEEIIRFISITGTNAEVLSALEEYRGRDETFDTGLDELTTVDRYIEGFGVPRDNFAIDLTIARGLDYYTGTVYETTLTNHPEVGSVCSGGRYDNLAEYYTDKPLPGVVISIGLTRLFFVLNDQKMLNEAMKYDEFVNIIQVPVYDFQYWNADGEELHVTLDSTDHYLTGQIEPPKDVTVLGGKTGTTAAAGNCLAVLTQNAYGQFYISVIVGALSKDDLYADMNLLLGEINE